MRWRQRWAIVSGLVIGGAALASACGDEGGVAQPKGVGGGSGTSGSGGGGATIGDVSTDTASEYVLSPQDPVVIVKTGQPLPTVDFDVTTTSGTPVAALWLIDRAEIGSIDQSGLFTASGKAAGQAKIEATVGSEKITTTITVKIEAEQNGGSESDGGTTGGGVGGVGGEGEGGAIDAALRALLEGATSSDPDLSWLYPYDKTVWPLGLLPPLLQWSAGAASVADGVYIHLSADNYDYKGFFGRPNPLSPGSPFVRHPIAKEAWEQATLSAAGGSLTLSLVVAAGGVAYGPIVQSWKIAKGQLKGTVYYQSYGTNLAKNYPGAMGGGMFGGATLAIKPGATDPTLVAGKSGGSSDCRVCHSVSADGSRMIVQHGNDYTQSSSYDLNGGYAESIYPAATNGALGWIGMSPDGSIGLGNTAPLPGAANGTTTSLYDLASGSAIASSGFGDLVTRAGFPAFSPDGKQVAFNFYAGPGDATIGAGDGTKLVVMDVDQATMTFSNARLLHQSAQRPGWPSFLPTGKSLVFQIETQTNGSEFFATRYGAKGELWWVDVATATAQPLERANGKSGGVSYLPTTGGTNHGDDTVLNYEPTVSPVPSGGYAWIVFLSRRMYGNVATIDPWASDPRDHDLTATATTKKLWVAAIDLDPQPGTDPSHPAFYLPGQELLAGNARGFWVVDPCKPDGAPCSSGDECCGGYCQQDPQTGELSCGQKTNECSAEFDKCTSDADCCDPSLKCINERCAMVVQ
jgi:hypothetical protein